jgi:hypothetical protein
VGYPAFSHSFQKKKMSFSQRTKANLAAIVVSDRLMGDFYAVYGVRKMGLIVELFLTKHCARAYADTIQGEVEPFEGAAQSA